MTSVPLRFRLFYDPLFLDLSRRFRDGFFGKLSGGGASAVVSSHADFLQVCAFFSLFFGTPIRSEVFADPAAKLGRVVFLFSDFAFSLDGLFIPVAVPKEAGLALTGSVSCGRSLVEFRFGTERLSSYALSENDRHRLAFPEGDGAFYRGMDTSLPEESRILSDESDTLAMEYVEQLLGSRFASFPGGQV